MTCTVKRERHKHGTAARYNHGPAGDGVDPCREDCCRLPMLAVQRERRARGTSPWVDADPVREHIARLRAAGLSIARVAGRAGLHYRTVTNVVHGNPSEGREPSAKVHKVTAHKIMSVAVPTRDVGWLRPSDKVVGRLRVLVARGWTANLLARRLGFDHNHVNRLVQGRVPTVTAATELAVIRLHKLLWNEQPPAGTRHERGAITRAKKYAAAHGWALPERHTAA